MATARARQQRRPHQPVPTITPITTPTARAGQRLLLRTTPRDSA
jgi:hypothetical protein